MEAWNHCGEGFAGVKKLSQLFHRRTQDVHLERDGDRENRSEAAIVSQVTPDEKRRSRKRGSLMAKTSEKGYGRKVSALSKGTWRRDIFLESFKTSEGSPSRQSDEIESVITSSDENENLSNADKEDKNESKVVDPCNKSPTNHKKKVIQSKDKSKVDCPKEKGINNTQNPSSSHHFSASSDKNCSVNAQKTDSNSKLLGCQTNQGSKKRWAVPSFQELDQLEMTSSQTVKSLGPKARRSDVKRDNHRKPKVVRRLQAELIQDSQGSISDVESDCEHQDTCDSQIEEADQQEASDSHIQRHEKDHATSLLADERKYKYSRSHILLDQREKYLSPEGISPASSPYSSPCASENSPVKVKGSPVNISSGSSLSSHPSQQRDTIKASEWVSALQKQRTPVKRDSAQCPQLEDSAKKKRKFASGSLADRLSRIQKRLKSSVRMWYHSAKSGALNGKEERSLVVRLLRVDKLCSLYLCTCRVATGLDKGRECQVLFSKTLAEMLSLKSGMSVQIYPPWQQLETSSGERTLLCTNFVCAAPVQEASTSPERSLPQANLHPVQVTTSWACPCSKDPRLPCPSCPAVKYPCFPPASGQRLDPRDTASTLHSRVCQQTGGRTATLQSVPSLNFPLHASDPSIKATTVSPSAGRTLLDSKEMLKWGSPILPPFNATVLRVFRQRSMDNTLSIRHQLLLKDSAGTVALAVLCLQSGHRGRERKSGTSTTSGQGGRECDAALNVGQLEGKACICSGFTVHSRITRDQDLSLFSVLEKAWPHSSTSGCQSQSESEPASSWQVDVSDVSQHAPSRPRAPPSFAYVLHAYPGSRGGQVEMETTKDTNTQQTGEECGARQASDGTGLSCHILPNSGLGLVTLHQALQGLTDDRTTFIAKMALCRGDEKPGHSSRVPTTVLVYDGTVDSSGHTLFHRLELGEQRHTGDFPAGVYLFRDVCLEKGSLQCDAYSLVLPQRQWSAWGNDGSLDQADMATVEILAACELRVPKLNQHAEVGTVVCLKGCVSGVDEESACMLEECCVCGSDLIVQDSGPMHCTVCGEDVEDSISVMKMAAFLTCPDVKSDVVVKVELTQKSIESILPSEADEDGYDIDHVIGQSISCGACIVQANTALRKESRKVIFLKELEYT